MFQLHLSTFGMALGSALPTSKTPSSHKPALTLCCTHTLATPSELVTLRRTEVCFHPQKKMVKTTDRDEWSTFSPEKAKVLGYLALSRISLGDSYLFRNPPLFFPMEKLTLRDRMTTVWVMLEDSFFSKWRGEKKPCRISILVNGL